MIISFKKNEWVYTYIRSIAYKYNFYIILKLNSFDSLTIFIFKVKRVLKPNKDKIKSIN